MAKKSPARKFRLATERDNEATKSHELFTEVGRTIVELSNIENKLGLIFHSLINLRVPTPVAMAPFYAQTWFEGKVQLVDLMMQLEGPDKAREKWRKIFRELKHHRKVRNLIAHQRLYVGWPDAEGRVNVSLSPHELHEKFDRKTESFVPIKGRDIDLAEVRATASALNRINKELSKVSVILDERYLPKEDRSDYIESEE